MSVNSKIEWTDATWNPVVGCTRVSEGCMNCYAERFAARFPERFGGVSRMTEYGPRWTGKIVLRPEALNLPLRWRKQRRIFVNSMSDLFHENVEFAHIVAIFRVMAIAQHHTFQILTKRPQRMLEVMNLLPEALKTIFPAEKHPEVNAPGWPLPNVWLGVSVENQRAADERIPLLLQTPAAVRFLSCEPLLGPVDLTNYLPYQYQATDEWGAFTDLYVQTGVDWVIVGGESGPGARPMHPDWVRGIRDQCVAAGVAFHFKQWGEWAPTDRVLSSKKTRYAAENGQIFTDRPAGMRYERLGRIGKKAAGRLLDGRTWDELPVVVR